MEDNDNLLSSYCFLAALTENQNDLLNHVYVPICNRTLSLYSLSGATHGTATDIKKIINDEYGIPIIYMSFDAEDNEVGVDTRLEAFYDMIKMKRKQT